MNQLKIKHQKEMMAVIKDNKEFIFFMYMEGYCSGKRGHAHLEINEEDYEPMGGWFSDFEKEKIKYASINRKSKILNNPKDEILVYFKIHYYEKDLFYGKMFMNLKDLNWGIPEN